MENWWSIPGRKGLNSKLILLLSREVTHAECNQVFNRLMSWEWDGMRGGVVEYEKGMKL